MIKEGINKQKMTFREGSISSRGVSLGVSAGMIVVGTIMTSSHADVIVAWKTDHGIIR